MMPPQVWGDPVWAIVFWLCGTLDNLRNTAATPPAQHILVYFRACARLLLCGDCTGHFLQHLRKSFRPQENIWPANYLDWGYALRTEIATKQNRRVRTREECMPHLSDGAWRKKFWTGWMMIASGIQRDIPVPIQMDLRALMEFVRDHFPWKTPITAIAILSENKNWFTTRELVIKTMWALSSSESRESFSWYKTETEWTVDLQTRIDQAIKEVATMRNSSASAEMMPAKPKEVVPLPAPVVSTSPPLLNIQQTMLDNRTKMKTEDSERERRILEANGMPKPFIAPHAAALIQQEREMATIPKPPLTALLPSSDRADAGKFTQIPSTMPTPIAPTIGTDETKFINEQAQSNRVSAFTMMVAMLIFIVILFLGFLFVSFVRRYEWSKITDEHVETVLSRSV